jgi:hypothetical protein
MSNFCLSRRAVNDAGEEFEVLILDSAKSRAVVLFAVGAGGDPDRHLAFLHSLAAQGCTIAAPRSARLVSSAPNADELATRARRLQFAFDKVAKKGIPAAGVGHSV